MAPRRLLVVDDMGLVHEMIRSYFRHHYPYSYQVVSAFNARDALREVRRKPPDLIILDVIMPGMSGFELCSKLLSYSETSHIPVIFLTCRKSEVDREIGLDLGAICYLEKPFSLEELAEKIEQVLRIYEGEVDEEIDYRVCPACAKPIAPMARFCHHCDQVLPLAQGAS